MVLAVLGLLGATVLLSIPTGQTHAIEQAERLSTHLQHARDEAILGNRAIAVRVDPTGYRFEQQSRGAWQALDERPFNAREFEAGVTATFTGREAFARFEFDVTGGSAPAGMTLVSQQQRVHVTLDDAGEVDLHVAPR